MKILICDSLEKEVIDIFSEIGEVTNISDNENKEDEISKNIVDIYKNGYSSHFS